MNDEGGKDFIYYIKLVGIVVATITGTSALWAAYPKDYWLAHRGYVIETVAEKLAPIVPTVNALATWQLEDAMSKLEAEAATWKIKLPSEPDPAIKEMIQRRINDINNQHRNLKTKLDELGGNGRSK